MEPFYCFFPFCFFFVLKQVPIYFSIVFMCVFWSFRKLAYSCSMHCGNSRHCETSLTITANRKVRKREDNQSILSSWKHNFGSFSVGYLTQICEQNIWSCRLCKAWIQSIHLINCIPLILHSWTAAPFHVARLYIPAPRHPHDPSRGAVKLQGCCLSRWRLDSALIKDNNQGTIHDLFCTHSVRSDRKSLNVEKKKMLLTLMNGSLLSLLFVVFFFVYLQCCLKMCFQLQFLLVAMYK